MFIRRYLTQLEAALSGLSRAAQLYSAQGELIWPEGDAQKAFTPPGDAVDGEPFQCEGFTGVMCEAAPTLYILVAGEDKPARDCAMLAARLARALAQGDTRLPDKADAYRTLLSGVPDRYEYAALVREYELTAESMRGVIVVRALSADAESMLASIEDIARAAGVEQTLTMDRRHLALIKNLSEQQPFEELEQLALAIQNTLHDETAHRALLGVSEPKKTLDKLYEAYSEGKRAIEVGHLFGNNARDDVFTYRGLLLERFLSDVDPATAKRYHTALFNKKTARLLDDELLHTLDTFFANNLNLSETARQLFMHRNTLVYRLDKLQRATGLDLRKFDDALTFRIMLLLGKLSDNNDDGR